MSLHVPDWTYHTILGPAVFALPPEKRGRVLAWLNNFGASAAAGPLVEFVGHMRPPTTLRRRVQGLELSTPIGLSADLPANADLLGLASRFGVGFAEIGPVAMNATPADSGTTLRRSERRLLAPNRPEVIAAADLERRLDRNRSHSAPIVVRLAGREGPPGTGSHDESARLVNRLARRAAFFTLMPPPIDDEDVLRRHLRGIADAAHGNDKKILLVVSSGQAHLALAARSSGMDGVWVGGGIPTGRARSLGADDRMPCRELVARVRESWPSAVIVAGAGAVEPQDALTALDEGADLVALDAGLVLAGPGLPKRINEALGARTAPGGEANSGVLQKVATGWIAFALLAGALIMSGALATWVALGRVVLPYDERFLGTTRAQLQAINEHLLPFLSHDRIALAGATLSIGVLYLVLCYEGYRYGAHWARTVIIASSIPGFASFYFYSLFGYFDPLDARATLLILCLFALGVILPIHGPARTHSPDLWNDRSWLRSLVGQLGFVVLGFGFIIGGLTIAILGSTSVFVSSDLAFLDTSPGALDDANGKLLSLVAHDRARFGGALLSVGVAILLLALWGIRRGARSVWWGFALAGIPGFAAGIGVHFMIGYVDAVHLFLPVLALAVYAGSLLLLHPYLCGERASRTGAALSYGPATV